MVGGGGGGGSATGSISGCGGGGAGSAGCSFRPVLFNCTLLSSSNIPGDWSRFARPTSLFDDNTELVPFVCNGDTKLLPIFAALVPASLLLFGMEETGGGGGGWEPVPGYPEWTGDTLCPPY